MSANAGVMEVLRAAAQDLALSGYESAYVDRVSNSIDAVAELVEARREFQEAEFGLSITSGDRRPFSQRLARYIAAEKRLDDAFAAMGGDS